MIFYKREEKEETHCKKEKKKNEKIEEKTSEATNHFRLFSFFDLLHRFFLIAVSSVALHLCCARHLASDRFYLRSTQRR